MQSGNGRPFGVQPEPLAVDAATNADVWVESMRLCGLAYPFGDD